MRRLPGEPAPNFTATTLDGETLTLSDLAGRRVQISFFRYASCPFCNLYLHRLAQKAELFAAHNLAVVALFQSPAGSLRRHAGRRSLPFPLIADPQRRIYRLYGVESSWYGYLKGALRLDRLLSAARNGYLPGKMEGDKALLPADFLLTPDLIIDVAHYGRDISDHLPLPVIEQWLTADRSAGTRAKP